MLKDPKLVKMRTALKEVRWSFLLTTCWSESA